MISIVSGRRGLAKAASLGVMLLTTACASQPSIGPNTPTGLPNYVDGGVGQVLRFCEKLHDRGDLATAAAMCERAHRLDPEAAEPLLELASILGEMNETDLSVQSYRTVLKTTPDNVQAHYGLGRIYLDQGQNDLALAAFETALRGDAKDPRLYRAVGIANGLLGAHEEAQRVFRAGLLAAPEDVALRNNLGLSLVQSGRYDEGLSILEALAKVPGAEQVSQENLAMAQGLAAAAHAEVMLAEARAEAEAEAKAEAEALAKAQAEIKTQTVAKMADTDDTGPMQQAMAPALQLNYPQHSWPMDGPGETGAAPRGTLAHTPTSITSRSTRTAQAATPTPAQPKPIAAPTPLTGPMKAGPAKSTTARPAKPRSGLQDRQTARADIGGTSDTGEMPGDSEGGPISWGQPREEVTPVPARLVKVGPKTAAPHEVAPHQAAPTAIVPQIASRAMPQKPTQRTAVPTGQGYAVQFASYTSEERAWRGWDSLQSVAATLLKDIEPNVRRADLGTDIGTVYRLRTTPVAKTNAETLCNALKAQDVECLVVKSEPKMAKGGTTKGPATL